MKTEISRDSHLEEKRYSGLYQQQGRMITDADWNEMVDIFKTRLQKALSTAIGSGISENKGILEVQRDPVTGIDLGTRELRWGEVVVDGLLAELLPADGDNSSFALHRQMDLPIPDGFSLVDGDYHLYLDVWERSVTSLEDKNLVDIALKGADTCSRSQMMTQLKWSPLAIDPDDEERNPHRGNAQIVIAVRDEAEQNSDPCAAQIGDSSNIGNFLFRVEVHEARFDNSGQLTDLILKWSRENGAEQYTREFDPPPGFVSSNGSNAASNDWVYEGFIDSQEKLLGMHLNSGVESPISQIQYNAEFDPYGDPGAPEYVRRWDGFAHLEFDGANWSLLEGSDRRQELGTDQGEGNHGHIAFATDDDGSFGIFMHLELFNLTVQLRDSSAQDTQFVTGDYWHAVVREVDTDDDPATLESEITLLNDGAPVGVFHHYLFIGQAELAQVGNEITLNNFSLPDAIDATQRQFSYPTLSDLHAERVEYNPERTRDRWQDVKELAPADVDENLPRNVQDAIDDLLLHLESSDVFFDLPGCASTSYGVDSFFTLISTAAAATLNPQPHPTQPGVFQVKLADLLSAILCSTDANLIPYDSSIQGADWTNSTGVTLPDPDNVQAAIDLLIDELNNLQSQISGQGCAITVGTNGNFTTIEDAVAAFPNSPSISLCLLADDFVIPNALHLDFSNSIKITGAGMHASRIVLQHPLQLESKEVILRDLQVDTLNSPGYLDVRANVSDLQRCWIRREALPNASWLQTFGSASFESLNAMASDNQGNLIFIGEFTSGAGNEVDFGNGVQVSSVPSSTRGNRDTYVVKFNSHGVAQWARDFGTESSDQSISIAADQEDNILMMGNFRGTAEFGGEPIDAGENEQMYLVKLSGADGAHIWQRAFQGERTSASSLSIGPDNSVLASGRFFGTATYEGNPILPTSGTQIIQDSEDGFIVRFSASGDLELVSDFVVSVASSVRNNDVRIIATDISDEGNILATGYFYGAELLISGETTLEGSQDSANLFVLNLDPDGRVIWAKTVAESNWDDSDGGAVLFGTGGFDIEFVSPSEAVLVGFTYSPIVFFDIDVELRRKTFGELFVGLIDISTGNLLNLTSASGQFSRIERHSSDGDYVYSSISHRGHLFLGLDSRTSANFADNTQYVTYRTNFRTGESELLSTLSGMSFNATVNGVHVVDDNRFIIAGRFDEETADFGNGVIQTSQDDDGFVAQYTMANRSLLSFNSTRNWLSPIGDLTSGDEMSSIALASDSYNGKIVCGLFEGSLQFLNQTYSSQDDTRDSFVAKFDQYGVPLWLKAISATGPVISVSVATAPDDDIILTGYVSGNVTIDGVEFAETVASFDIFLLRLDPFGNLRWFRRFGSDSSDIGFSVQVDTSGNIVLAGLFVGTVEFSASVTIENTGLSDGFVAKFDPSGEAIWAEAIGGESSDRALDIALDSEDSIYITGNFINTVSYSGLDSISAENELTHIFALKVNTDGVGQWLRAFGASEGVGGHNIRATSDLVYLSGYFRGTLQFPGGIPVLVANENRDRFIVQLDQDGEPQWAQHLIGEDQIRGVDLTLTNDNQLLVSSDFSGLLQIGDASLNGPPLGSGQYATFLVKFTSDGEVTWTRSLSSDESIRSLSILVDNRDAICLIGSMTGRVQVDEWPVKQFIGQGEGAYLAYLMEDVVAPEVNIEDCVFDTPPPESNLSGTVALDFIDTNLSLNLRNNKIYGRVLLGTGELTGNINNSTMQEELLKSDCVQQITVTDNYLRQFNSRVPDLGSGSVPFEPYYANMTFMNNTFEMPNNRFITGKLTFTYNNMLKAPDSEIALAHVNSFMVVGNLGRSTQEFNAFESGDVSGIESINQFSFSSTPDT